MVSRVRVRVRGVQDEYIIENTKVKNYNLSLCLSSFAPALGLTRSRG